MRYIAFVSNDREHDLLTRTEVRDLLRISRQTLWRREQDGSLVPVRVGKTVRYRRSQIEGLIELAPKA